MHLSYVTDANLEINALVSVHLLSSASGRVMSEQ
jgi:hypothetical protein